MNCANGHDGLKGCSVLCIIAFKRLDICNLAVIYSILGKVFVGDYMPFLY